MKANKMIFIIVVSFIFLLSLSYAVEGDFISSIQPSNASAMITAVSGFTLTDDNQYFWIKNTTSTSEPIVKVWKNNFSIITNADVSANMFSRGICGISNAYFGVSSGSTGSLRKYTSTWTYLSQPILNRDIYDCDNVTDEFLWITNATTKNVLKYYVNGTIYNGFNSINMSDNGFADKIPRGITTDENYIWVSVFEVGQNAQIFKYWVNNGTYIKNFTTVTGCQAVSCYLNVLENNRTHLFVGLNNGSVYTFATGDIQAPTLTIDSTNGSYYNRAPIINGTCTDDVAINSIKTDAIEYLLLDSTSPFNFTNQSALTNGGYTIQVSCNDTSGNTVTKSIQFTFDDIPPTITISAPATNKYWNYSDSPFYINGTASDTNLNTSYSDSTIWALYDLTPANWQTFNTSNVLDNNYTIVFSVNDSAGNVGTTTLVLSIDITAPTITVDVANDTDVGYGNLTGILHGMCYDNVGISQVWTNLTQFSTIDTAMPFNFTNTTLLTEGTTYTIRLSCNDTTNNLAYAEVRLHYTYSADITTPEINIVSPAQNVFLNYSNRPFTITGTSTDNFLDTIWSNSTVWYLYDISPGAWSVNNQTALTDGNYTINFTVNDTTNNQNSSYLTIVYDSTPPAINYTAPTLNNHTISTNNWIYVNLSFIDIYNESCYLYWNGTSELMSKNLYSCYVNKTALLVGRGYYFYVIANDSAKNTNRTEALYIILSQNPQINYNYSLPIAPTLFEETTFRANVTDPNNDLQSVNFTLRYPNGTITTLNYINGSQQGDFWNSSIYRLDAFGVWNISILAIDSSGGQNFSSFNISIDDRKAILPLTYTQAVKTNDQLSFNLSILHYSNSTQNFTMTNFFHTAQFNVTFSPINSINVSYGETNVTNVTIVVGAAVPAGTYTNNISVRREFDANTTNITLTFTVSAQVANVDLYAPTSWTIVMYDDQSTSQTFNVRNFGGDNYNLSYCNASTTLLNAFATYNNTQFNMTYNQNVSLLMTLSSVTAGVYNDNLVITCRATSNDGLDTDSATISITTTARPAAIILSGGGGAPISTACGNNLCESGEDKYSCPADCLALFNVSTNKIEFAKGLFYSSLIGRSSIKEFWVQNNLPSELNISIYFEGMDGSTLQNYAELLVAQTRVGNNFNGILPSRTDVTQGIAYFALKVNYPSNYTFRNETFKIIIEDVGKKSRETIYASYVEPKAKPIMIEDTKEYWPYLFGAFMIFGGAYFLVPKKKRHKNTRY